MNIWIHLSISSIEYKNLVDHIAKNMFFGVKRIAPNLRHIIFHSIGDAMYEDLQDLEHAEIYLQQKIADENMTEDILNAIMDNKKWYISAADPKSKKVLNFIVEKDTDLILFRQEKSNNERPE